MRLSFKIATLAALATLVKGKRPGLSLSEFNSILSTDVNGLLEESSVGDASWETLTEREWERAISKERSHEDGLGSSLKEHSFPYIVCSSSTLSGNKIRERVESHFDSSPVVALHNSESKTCFLASAPASLAESAPEDMIVQPHFAEMKMAKGTLRHLQEENHTGRLSAMLCPSKSVTTDAEATAVTSDIFSKHSEGGEALIAAEKARLLMVTTAFDTRECRGAFPTVEGGYKGESVQVDLPADAPASCLLFAAHVLISSPRVCYVEVTQEMKLMNAESQWILQSGEEDERPWFDVGLDGAGQVVAVSDSGLDMNNCYFIDVAGNINRFGIINPKKRKVVQYVPHMGFNDDELIGHGTHVCATVAGRKFLGKTESKGIADGVAREAKIAFMDVGLLGPIVLPPFVVSRLFEPGQDAGAKIHSASWGGPAPQYSTQDRGFDSWVADNPDFLPIIAAGNSGAMCKEQVSPCPENDYDFDIPNTILSPANAKNVIAVGATESFGNELTEPWMLGYEYLAYFSSRGPTSDGRTKPDILAPGFDILSARSHGRSGEFSCDNINNGTKFMAGTSMATPAVSGTAALVRQYFEEGWYPTGQKTAGNEMNPSAALVKAVLMNGAQFIKGVSNMGNVTEVSPYDNNQNFGRINMMTSLHLAGSGNQLVYAADDSVTDGEDNTIRVTVSLSEECSSDTLSATLVWTDLPAFPACSKCLMNDLDLVVLANNTEDANDDGKIVFPNGLGNPDIVNNAERAQLTVQNGDIIDIKVSGTNMVTEKQDYALVVTGCFTVDA